MSVATQHEPSVGVSEQGGHGVRGEPRGERVRRVCMACVMKAGERLLYALLAAGALEGCVALRRADRLRRLVEEDACTEGRAAEATIGGTGARCFAIECEDGCAVERAPGRK